MNIETSDGQIRHVDVDIVQKIPLLSFMYNSDVFVENNSPSVLQHVSSNTFDCLMNYLSNENMQLTHKQLLDLINACDFLDMQDYIHTLLLRLKIVIKSIPEDELEAVLFTDSH